MRSPPRCVLTPFPAWAGCVLCSCRAVALTSPTSVQVLESYLSTTDTREQDRQTLLELGEIELYMARIHKEAGHLDKALAILDNKASHICDRVSKLEMQVRAGRAVLCSVGALARTQLGLLALSLGYLQAEIKQAQGAVEQAQSMYRELIGILPDNYVFHRGLCTALNLPATLDAPPADILAALKGVYAELAEQHPDCAAVKRITLDFLHGAEFSEAAKTHMWAFVRRGVPSLFSDLKPLAQLPAKDQLLWDVAVGILQDVAADSLEAVWVHLYLAQHAAVNRRWPEAIEHISAAEGSPGLGAAAVDVFSAKADILADVGDPAGAAAAAETARLLDLKDRYVNSMAAKYWFRAGDAARAKKTALLFALDFEGKASNLGEMQVMWYELESGQAFLRSGDVGMVCPSLPRCSCLSRLRHQPVARCDAAVCAGAQDVHGGAEPL